ncbi:MAG: hypothetical protein QOH72_1276 [Solirubrobacteraceae bacterium]|nr:hypothetical protein [Solirubrobacteraceae bacterium]
MTDPKNGGNDGQGASPSATVWLAAGLVTLVAGFGAALWIGGKGSSVFKADGSFAALAGFTVLALALERLSEAVLAPWWGTVRAKKLKQSLPGGGDPHAAVPPAVRRPATTKIRLGVTDLTRMLAASRAGATDAPPAAGAPVGDAAQPTAAEKEQTEEAVQSAWEKAVAARPTLLLPAAAIATTLCAAMHLFLFHSIAAKDSGLPTGRLAFATDALLTGLALAGGAKPFHDLTESIAAKSSSNKQEAAANATETPAAG